MKLLLFMTVVLGSACSFTADPQKIVDKAIVRHGSEAINHTKIEFDFRGRHYVVTRKNHGLQYQRFYQDSGRAVSEILFQDSVSRYLDGVSQALSRRKHLSLHESINSVVYFSLLPYFLNDAAVVKRYLGSSHISAQPYEKVEITFRQAGGGIDYQDRYIYWIHKKRSTIDFLAYRFHVNGGGTRFRVADNRRSVQGITFQDYVNYGVTKGSARLRTLSSLRRFTPPENSPGLAMSRSPIFQ